MFINMRVLFILIVVYLMAFTLANPAGNKKQPTACARDCGEKFEPICAKEKNGNKFLTFGNECVMGRFNCEHPENQYETKSKGECSGNVSVRLS